MAADGRLLVELMREMRAEMRSIREEQKEQAQAVADLKRAQETDDAVKKLVSKYLPWALAALGFGGAGTAVGVEYAKPPAPPTAATVSRPNPGLVGQRGAGHRVRTQGHAGGNAGVTANQAQD